MSELFFCAVASVATIILAAMPGFLLVKFKVLNSEALRLIGKVVVYAALPALLATKLADAISPDSVAELWIFPVSCVVFIFGGFLIAKFANLFLKEKSELKGVLYTASTLGNAAYLPLPLIVAICAVFPIFRNQPDAATRGITFISAFIVAFSPLSWIFGYNTISGKGHKIALKYFFPPPVIGILVGLIIGMTPFLKHLLCSPQGVLYPLFESWRIIAGATVPLAMIVLGGRFAIPPESASISNKMTFTIVFIKLFLLPTLAIGYIFLLRYLGIINNDPMIALVLIIEAAVPPANNLILMASMHRVNEHATAKVLFICYALSTITLTLFITLAMAIF